MIVWFAFAVLCLWMVFKPQSYVNSLNDWNQVVGLARRQAPLWLVRVFGLAVLCLLIFLVMRGRLD